MDQNSGIVERIPFPQTDEFRRAKRNSLLWSGLTVLAALAVPIEAGDSLAFTPLGSEAAFPQRAVIGITGGIAIFMAIGFFQAARRLMLFASKLFAGSGASDVEKAFQELSIAAKRAQGEISTVRSHVESIKHDVRDMATRQKANVDDLQIKSENLSRKAPRLIQGETSKFLGIESKPERHPESDADFITRLSQWNTALENSDRLHEAEFNAARQKVNEIHWQAHSELMAISSDSFEGLDDRIKSIVHPLEIQVSQMRRFHDGIYRADRLWFWCYDIAPVAALFIMAMIPTMRVLFPL